MFPINPSNPHKLVTLLRELIIQNYFLCGHELSFCGSARWSILCGVGIIFLSQNCCPTLFLEWWGRQVKSQRRNWIIYLRRNHHGGFSFDWIIYLWSNCCGGLQLIDLYGGARLIRMFATWWWTTIRLRITNLVVLLIRMFCCSGEYGVWESHPNLEILFSSLFSFWTIEHDEQ